MISIITPSLNSERFIEDTLRSIWGSTNGGRQIEHIVVDGESTDGTAGIVGSYPSRLISGRDGGMYEAINKGLTAATGEIFGYVNSDDELTPGALERVARAFAANPDKNWLVAPMILIDGDGNALATLRPPRWLSPTRFRALGWNCFPQPSTFFRTEFARNELGGFDTSYRFVGDWDFFLRALDRGRPIYVSQPLSRFRLHDTNLSRQRTDMRADARPMNEKAEALGEPRRSLLRFITKAQINITNPGWAIGKRTGKINY